jgi:hypothetical protein
VASVLVPFVSKYSRGRHFAVGATSSIIMCQAELIRGCGSLFVSIMANRFFDVRLHSVQGSLYNIKINVDSDNFESLPMFYTCCSN